MEKYVDLVLLAGEILLTSGAEMYRVEETITRMGLAAGFSDVEVIATPTGLFISLHTDNVVYTRVRRIRAVNNNLAFISEVNALSRAFSEGTVTAEDVLVQLEILANEHNYRPWYISIACGIGSGAFAIIFGGTFLEAIFAFLIGTIVLLVTSLIEKYPVPHVLIGLVGGSVAAGLGAFIGKLCSINTDVIILGSVIILVPGVVMTTALRDMLSGELVSGVSRGAEALVIAVAIAAGVAIVLSVGGV